MSDDLSTGEVRNKNLSSLIFFGPVKDFFLLNLCFLIFFLYLIFRNGHFFNFLRSSSVLQYFYFQSYHGKFGTLVESKGPNCLKCPKISWNFVFQLCWSYSMPFSQEYLPDTLNILIDNVNMQVEEKYYYAPYPYIP